MNRRQSPPAILALIAVVTLVSACGGSGTPTGGAAGSGNSTAASAARAVKFSSCMRHNGVSSFPDLTSGKVTLDAIANGSSLDTNSPAFTQALTACKSLEPAGFTGGTRSTVQQSAALRFAACIRRHGVSDFPDPINGQPLIDTNRIPSANRPGGMSALHAAMQSCSGLAAQAMGKRS